MEAAATGAGGAGYNCGLAKARGRRDRMAALKNIVVVVMSKKLVG